MKLSFKFTFTLLVCMFLGTCIQAQELRSNISINTSRIQGTNKNIFNTLQRSLYEFVNETKWTNNVFTNEERIECSFFFTLTEQIGSDRFKGTLQVQVKRPVYGTSYQTITFNFLDDDIVFDYIEFDKLEFDITSFRSNLTSIMAFYAYLIIGIDYDTFMLKGGEEYLRKAEEIIITAQNENFPGWKPYEKTSRRNRYWIIENMLNSKYSLMRGAYYKYHRLGMDKMSERADEGRQEIYQSLLDIQKVYQSKPDSYMFFRTLFFDAKADEIVNVFSEGALQEKTRVFQVLQEIDNANLRKYEKIKEASTN